MLQHIALARILVVQPILAERKARRRQSTARISNGHAERRRDIQSFENYQPSKTILVWACIAAEAATMIVGFNWGGWVTGGTSRMAATSAGDAARGELASAICVQRFNAAPQATAKLVELKALGDGYKQRQFVEAGGWATMPGQTSPDRRAVEGCAATLAT